MKKTALLALLMLSPLTASADIHKCVVNGHTTYQDAPCTQGEARLSNSGTLSTLPIQVLEISSPAPRNYQPVQRSQRSRGNRNYQSTTERRNAEVRAAARGVVIPGMSERQAITILGQPSSTSTHTYSGRVCRNLYWDGSRPFQDGRHSVRICNGEVSSYSGR